MAREHIRTDSLQEALRYSIMRVYAPEYYRIDFSEYFVPDTQTVFMHRYYMNICKNDVTRVKEYEKYAALCEEDDALTNAFREHYRFPSEMPINEIFGGARSGRQLFANLEEYAVNAAEDMTSRIKKQCKRKLKSGIRKIWGVESNLKTITMMIYTMDGRRYKITVTKIFNDKNIMKRFYILYTPMGS